MTTALRKVQALKIPGLKPAPISGRAPRFAQVAPTALFIDETYQRGISKESYRLIRKLVAGFDWRHVKPPIVAQVDDGLHVLDGQHTAIAAATLGLAEIPVVIVDAAELADRARAFVGHNCDRIKVSTVAIYHAQLAAQDPDALDVANVCRRAGVRIRTMNHASAVKPGDTMAIGTIRAIIRRRGVRVARKVLELLVAGGRAPISADEIAAADLLMSDERFAGIDAAGLPALIQRDGEQDFIAARAAAAREKLPVRDVLARQWALMLPAKAVAA